MSLEQSGAFTGEISASMLSAIGVNYVIIGHSERRTYFGETDVTVNQRVRAALNEGLTVILCVGEYLEQREQGITAELVAMQVKIALDGVSRRRVETYHHRLRACLGNWHRENRNCSAGKRSLRCDSQNNCRTLLRKLRKCNHYPIRWFYERQKCRRIIITTGC